MRIMRAQSITAAVDLNEYEKLLQSRYYIAPNYAQEKKLKAFEYSST